jgi:hypothetical protein
MGLAEERNATRDRTKKQRAVEDTKSKQKITNIKILNDKGVCERQKRRNESTAAQTIESR